ncbi:hypothetical protein, partial [Escherichia coli]|uniref:hypothetical protein n=1 Tax=Escherichia coli TaxID=562 RepID=UPI001BAF0ADA
KKKKKIKNKKKRGINSGWGERGGGEGHQIVKIYVGSLTEHIQRSTMAGTHTEVQFKLRYMQVYAEN